MTTWNPADKSSGVTLSNGNLTALKNDIGYDWARSTESKNTGKVYFECVVDGVSQAADYAAAGTAIPSSALTDYLGQEADSSAYYADGSVWAGNGPVASLTAYTTGDVIGCAIDLDVGKGWYSKNGVFASGDPAAGTGQHFSFTPATSIFAGFTLATNGVDGVTANFGASAFAHAAPSGFTAWDVTPVVAAVAQALTYGAAPHTLDPRKVRAKWEEIEEIERRIKAKEEAEREKIRKIEDEKRTLAELEEKKRQTRTIADRRRKIQARIAEQEEELRQVRLLMAELMDEIEKLRAEIELQQTIADRRRRMALLLAAAA